MGLQNVDIYGGTVSPRVFNAPAGSIGNAAIGTSVTDPLDADKLEHQHQVTYRQRTGSDVATQTEDLYTAFAAGEISNVDVVATTAPTGGDKQFTVDVQKGDQGGAFATVLTGVVTINSTIANRQVVAASLVGDPSFDAGDTFRVIVTASGATGSQGQGLVVTITLRAGANP